MVTDWKEIEIETQIHLDTLPCIEEKPEPIIRVIEKRPVEKQLKKFPLAIWGLV